MIQLIVNKRTNKNITTFLNPFSYVLSRDNKAQLEAFDIKIDGAILVLILNLFGFNCKRKSFDMTSLAPVVFNDAVNNNQSIYFIGTKPKVIDLAIKNIQVQFPELKICGYSDGYIDQDQRLVVFDTINFLKADYVICGMGTPLQEQFLIDLQLGIKLLRI